MARHALTGHADRYHKHKISAACVGGIGGKQTPYVAPAFQVSEADLAVLEHMVKDLERVLKGQQENRQQEIAREYGG